jgi:hypothetical protein
MQERMFPIGANLTQGNLFLFRNAELEIRVIGHMQTGSVEILDKEKPLSERAGARLNGQFQNSSSYHQYSRPISSKAGGIMSGMALIWAANVKGLKLAAKIVLIQLADFHNKETGQCNPIAKGLADECEMGRATLFRHMTTLDECGLVTRHARGDGDGGRGSNQYELHLDITLGPSSRPKGVGRALNGVVSQNETGETSQKR